MSDPDGFSFLRLHPPLALTSYPMFNTFNERLINTLETELKAVGLTIKKARETDKNNPDLMFVIGKLLSTYPVSFNIDFFISTLDLQVSKSPYKERCTYLYNRSKKKVA